MEGSAAGFDAARKRLWDELVSLHDTWAEYNYLYGDKDRVRLLNACAPAFFARHERLLLREVILGISRLTDPPKTGKFDNLVLESLVLDPAVAEHEGLREELEPAIKAAVTAAAPIRTHRNKYIAHLDHGTAIGSPSEPLPGLKGKAITAVVTAMGEVYNVHGGRVRESHAFFESSSLGGADALVRILEKSERWRLWREINASAPTEGE